MTTKYDDHKRFLLSVTIQDRTFRSIKRIIIRHLSRMSLHEVQGSLATPANFQQASKFQTEIVCKHLSVLSHFFQIHAQAVRMSNHERVSPATIVNIALLFYHVPNLFGRLIKHHVTQKVLAICNVTISRRPKYHEASLLLCGYNVLCDDEF